MQEPQAPRDPSPLDVRDELVRYARDLTNHKAATRKLLDAGRGTPNWIATTPREAFFMLGQFALEESKRVWDEPDLGGLPRAEGIAERLRAFLTGADDAGAELLRHALDYGVTTLRFEPDAFIHELVGGVVGDNYPVPARMLEHAEVIVRKYLTKTLCAGRPPAGAFDLFAVEGGTAALGYVFRSLLANNVLRRGDTIACGTPSAAPSFELEELALTTLTVSPSETVNGRPVWQYPDAEIAKLEDPKVKAFFLVNPGNPGSCALRHETVARIVELVRTKRPDLLVVTDDVYGPFVEGFRSLAAELPRNTILVYSFSKAFGCAGWRLGVVALHERNVIDEALERLPDAERERLRQRYGGLERDPGAMKFVDRMVADSRGVALSPTAGLSPPQQIQMTLFALFALLDVDDEYQTRCRSIIRGRFKTLFDALGVPTHDDPLRAGYYAEVDLAVWGHRTFGDEFASYVEAHPDPLEIVLELARRHGVVLPSGRAFDGPPWVARVSLANLDAEDYAAFGRELKEIAAAAVGAWRDGTGGEGRLERGR